MTAKMPALAALVFLAVKCSAFIVFCWNAYKIRLHAIEEYGRVIHEFDPWFNYRATEYLAEHGWTEFFHWFDHRSWYPLGRPVGTTIYPGMQISAVVIWKVLGWVGIDMSLNDVCVFMPCWYGVSATVFLAAVTYECTHSSSAAVAAAGVMAVIPAHIMRSVGGGYDNESVAMTCMLATFYFWCRSLRNDQSWWYGSLAGLAYIYMVAAWGGYIFVINMVAFHAGALVMLGRGSSKLFKSYALFYLIGTWGAMKVPVVGWAPLKSLEQLGALAVLILLCMNEVVEHQRRKRKMSFNEVMLLRMQVLGVAGLCVAAIVAVLLPTGYFGPLSARIRGLFVRHTRTGNPLVDSVAEHQPASSQAYWQYLHVMCYIAPIGFIQLLWNRDDSKYFLTAFACVAYYFSIRMMRLILLMAPVASSLGGVAIGTMVEWAICQIFNLMPDMDDEEEEEDEDEDELDEEGNPVLDEDGNPKKKPRKPKFVPDAMVSPINPFSTWGNEPLIEVLELPVETLISVRRAQRRQLLEYKEEQDGIATEEMESIVRDEQEQLVEQLDERIRQWAPRPGRAEMDVYEVRDTQLHQHQSKTDRHVGSLSMRASSQQAYFSELYGNAESDLKRHLASQKARVAGLAYASNTPQLGNYERLAKQECSSFIEAAEQRAEGIETYSAESMNGLRKMNKQFLDGCYVFEELGGPKGKDGTYNPEEVEVFKQRLDELDEDVAERGDVWVKHSREQLERHVERSKEALEEFHAAIKDVETDITILEGAEKQIRSCSLLQLQEQSANDAAMDKLDQKLTLLDALCDGIGTGSIVHQKPGEDNEEEDAKSHANPVSIQILQCLKSIRWRVHSRAKYLGCLQSEIELTDITCVPPVPEDQPKPPAAAEEIPADEETGQEFVAGESENLRAFRERIWPTPPEEEGGEGAEPPADGEGSAKEVDEWEEVLKRYPGLQKEDKEVIPAATFMEALASIHEKQKAELHNLVEEYYNNLGEREITRKKGDPACTATRYIPDSLEEFDEKNEASLTELHESAVEYLKTKVRYFRSQIAKLSTTMPRVAAALFSDISERTRKRERARLKVLRESYEDDAAAWKATRDTNNANLKPSLGNENARPELEGLCVREAERHEAAVKGTDDALINALQVMGSESWHFYAEVLHGVAQVLGLFDTTVQPADLVLTDEDVVAQRKTLITLLKEYVKIEAEGEQPPPPEGKAFHTREYKGVRQGRLGAAPVFLALQAMEEDAAAGAVGVLAAIDEGVTDATTANDTPNHAHVIKSRDRILSGYTQHFALDVENLIRHYSAIKREEQRWYQNWNSLVESLKEQ